MKYKASKNNSPLVSVHMITYNHELYIAQAIESILAQKTDFPFEIVIGEDCSTDKTREIALGYQEHFPEIVRVICSNKNVGFLQNEMRVTEACRGKYLAFCEGDDFWHNSNKLQMQVDFLEANPDFGLVHSDVNHLYQSSGKLIEHYNKFNKHNIPEGFIFDDLIDTSKNHGHIIKTMTVCLRKELIDKYWNPKIAEERNWMLTDLPLWLDISKHTKIHYIDECLATYRLLDESASRTKNPKKIHQFHLSVSDVRRYYMEKYNCTQKLKDDFEIRFNNMLLSDAFFINDKEIAKKAWGFLKGRKVKLNTKQKLFYLGTKSKSLRKLIGLVK